MSANRPHAILPSAHNGQRAHASRAFNQQLRVQGFKPYTFHLYLHVRVLYYYCHTSSSTSQPFHNKPDFKTVQHPTLRPGLPTPPRPTPLVRVRGCTAQERLLKSSQQLGINAYARTPALPWLLYEYCSRSTVRGTSTYCTVGNYPVYIGCPLGWAKFK